MALRVWVEGPAPDRVGLEEALRERFGELELIVWGVDQLQGATAESFDFFDLLILFLEPADRRRCVNALYLLEAVIDRTGVWGCLASIVVGEPPPLLRNAFTRLRASGYLENGLRGPEVAAAAFEAWRLCWWRSERQRDVPSLVVNRDGVIERANPFACERFGRQIVSGQRYTEVVEGTPDGILPDSHPIARAIDANRGVSEAMVFRRDGQGHQLFLSCIPLLRPDSRSRQDRGRRPRPSQPPPAASVLVLDLGRWERIIEAANDFARATGREDLLDRIIEQGNCLGFQRLRLYQQVAGQLQGRRSHGFAPVKAEWFKTFVVDVGEDQTAKDIRGRDGPRLYVPNALKERSTPFEYHFVGPAAFEQELEKQEVLNWIETPINLPPLVGGGPRFWGKLSIDNGPNRGVDIRDIGDVAVFSSVVGLALGMMQRSEAEREFTAQVEASRKQAEHFRDLVDASSKLVGGIFGSDDDVFPTVIGEVLGLYLEMTGGDAALFRRYDETAPDSLRREGEPRFRSGLDESSLTIPVKLPNSRLLSGYFEHFRTDAPHGPVPYIKEGAFEELQRYLEQHGSALDDEVKRYVNRIRHEMHIPVFSGEAVRGVVVVVMLSRDERFSEDGRAIVEKYMRPLSIWLELARRNDSQRRVRKALDAITSQLPKLAALPLDSKGEEAFFAALAAMLTSHLGLSWNRAFVFSCQTENAPLKAAESAYAVGGLFEDYAARSHGKLQDGIGADPDLGTLAKLVDARIREPDPHWKPKGAQEYRDQLYDRVKSKAIRIGYREGEPTNPRPEARFADRPVGRDVETGVSIFWTPRPRDQAASAPPSAEPTRFDGKIPNEWIRGLNSACPGPLFDETKPIYGYTLWCAFDDSKAPLGCVLLDNPGRSELLLDAQLDATRLVLGLVSDILAMRYLRCRLGGYIESLQFATHGRRLASQWNSLDQKIEGLRTVFSKDSEEEAKADFLDSFRAWKAEGNDYFEELVKQRGAIGSAIERLDGTTKDEGIVIPDLGRHLRLLVVDDLESADIVEIARGVGIPAPGYELVVVKDCWKDAEDALQQRWDLAVIDIKLWHRPEGGIELIRRLHDSQPFCNIIAITSGDRDVKQRALDAGARVFVYRDAERRSNSWTEDLEVWLKLYKQATEESQRLTGATA
jgi:hypothetical protein